MKNENKVLKQFAMKFVTSGDAEDFAKEHNIDLDSPLNYIVKE